MSIPRPEIKTLLQSAFDIVQTEYATKEETALGTLRGGNTGCIAKADKIIGKCHRLSMLRSMGIQKPTELSSNLMFDQGFANEDIWLELLKKSWNGLIRAEEDIPVRWKTDTGTLVTGRPDTVLCDTTGRPVLGIEHKQVVSIWSAREFVFKDVPKADHLVQAAHYSWQLGVPFDLVYTHRGNLHFFTEAYDMSTRPWMDREARECYEKFGDEYVEFKDDNPFKFKPFVKIFNLEWDDDELYYKGFGDWVKTAVTKSGIKEYYEKVSTMAQKKALGPMFVARDYKARKDKNLCDYCLLQDECLRQETDYNFDRFVETAKQLFS